MKGFISFALVFSIFLVSCSSINETPAGVNIMEESELLALYERNGFDEVIICNRRGDEVAHYALVYEKDTSKLDIPAGCKILHVPIQNFVIDSEVYAGALEELEAVENIKGMFDGEYATSPQVKKKLAEAEINNLGPSQTPDAEQLVKLGAEAVLLSYFDGMQTGSIDKTGVPIVKMYDLQEESPLGRAEWIRLIGRLVNKSEKSDSIFNNVKKTYSSLKEKYKRQDGDKHPKILTEIMYEGVWNVAGGKSYQAKMIAEAGGDYFFNDDKSAVTLMLPPEKVLEKGADADIWIIRYFGNAEELKQVLNSDPVYKEFKAFKNGNVYFSDTSESGIFREFPFHPELLLKDYIGIFNNGNEDSLRYFKKIK